MKQVIQALQQQGWPATDIQIYVLALQHDSVTPAQIRKTAKIPKTTCRMALKRLMQRGLMTRNVKDLNVTYRANSPQVLLTDLDKRRKTIQEAVAAIQSLRRKAKK